MNYKLSRPVWNARLQCVNILSFPNSILDKVSVIRFVFLLLFVFAFSTSVDAATFTVNTLLDNESNGCAAGNCTLREAINDANALPGADTINFDNTLTGTITLNGNALSISSDISINGPGARTLAVNANDQSRVFIVRDPNVTANISGLTITGGNAQALLIGGITLSDGGGILNTNGATLNLTEVAIHNNRATTLGGGIATRAILLRVSNTNIIRSTISGNTATAGGGGISNLATSLVSFATTNITNSTITDNITLAEGGGISNSLGNLNLTNNTISDNRSVVAGGGIVNAAVSPLGSVSMRNNIVARNSAVLNTDLISSDLLGIFNSQGNNLIGNNLNVSASFAASVFVGGSPTPNANGDLVGSVAVGFKIIHPLLGNLQNNGGQTDTRLLLTGSPAINNGNNCVTDGSCDSLTNDQRGAGFSRLLDSTVDIGAVEGVAPPNSPIVVTTLADDETDGCGTNECTLREAIAQANASPDYDVINFVSSLQGKIVLDDEQLIISTNLTINGPGARKIGVSGNNADRVFLVAIPVLGGEFEVEINGLTITEGRALPVGNLAGDGGGILNGALLGVVSGKSTLRLDKVNVSRNFATTLGGGIATRSGSTTIITDSLISGNNNQGILFLPAGNAGGGGVSNTALSTTVIANSTITNNRTLAAGGGILNVAGDIDLINNTISHNQSTLAGGGVVGILANTAPFGVINLRNTIIAKNRALSGINLVSSDVLGVLGSFNSLGNNLIGNNVDAEANFEASVFVGSDPQPNANLDLVGNINVANQIIDPKLSPLRHHGGPTNTRLPQVGSPALNAGNNCVQTSTCPTNNPPSALAFDQRGTGFPRVVDSTVEIGATEGPTNVAALLVTTLADNESDGCGVNECTLREAITEANTDFEFDEINFQPGLNGTIPLQSGQLVISSNMLINGLGARNLTIDAQDASRVFMIATPILGGDFDVEINKMTITGGRATPVGGLAGDGGGVLNGALLGVLSGKSNLTLREVNVHDNFATTLGGGVATRLGAETIIVNSLIDENVSNAQEFIPGGDVGGGGVSNVLSTTVIANSTVAGNNSLAAGGGILNAVGKVYSTNNTITDNQSAVIGGGINTVLDSQEPLEVTYLRNTIIAENTALIGGTLFNSNVAGSSGSYTSYGNNLIEDNVNGETDFPPSVFNGSDPLPNPKLDLVGSTLTQLLSPQLSPLQDNGGQTNTRQPSPLSPAMNAGDSCVTTNTCAVNPDNQTPHEPLETDQRGEPRQANSSVEMGSTETTLAPTSASVSISGRVMTENGSGIYRATVTVSDSAGNVYTAISNPFGYYRIENVPAGTTVVITATHKFYVFPTQTLIAHEDVTNQNILVGSKGSRGKR